MDKLKATINKGLVAQQLLEEMTPIFAQVEADIHHLWAATKTDDSEGREAAYRELHGLKAVKARIDTMITSGKLAEQQLEHEKHGDGNT